MAASGKTIQIFGGTPKSVGYERTSIHSKIREDEGDWFKPGSEILMSSTDQVVSAGCHRNGFIGAFQEAHKKNLGVIVKPDDVWLTLMIAYGNFLSVKENAEKMRSTFVDHLGQAQLIIDVLDRELTDYQLILNRFAHKISNNIKDPKIKEWVEPGFTTTTPYLQAISQVALMASLKHYFAYGVMGFRCAPNFVVPAKIKKGIAWVHMEGTRDDWWKLGLKLNYLNELGVLSGAKQLSIWAEKLALIVWNLILTYDGKPDLTWWKRLNHLATKTPENRRSRLFDGWLTYFAPFEEGKWVAGIQRHINDKNYSSVHVPVKIKIQSGALVPPLIQSKLDSRRIMDAMIYAGVVRNSYDSNQNTMKPVFDFALVSLPHGSIPDSLYDWNDRETVKVVGGSSMLPLPAPASTASMLPWMRR